MIIVLKQDAPDVQVREFCHELEDMGLQINDSKGSDTHILGLIGDTKAIAESWVLANPVVETCRRVSEPYKKANRNRLFLAANGLKQLKVLHIAGSDLDQVDFFVEDIQVIRRHQFCYDRKSGLLFDCTENVKSFQSESLERIRACSRFESAAAQHIGSGSFDRFCDSKNLLVGFYRTRTCNQCQIVSADFDTGYINNRILRMKGAVGKLIRFLYMHNFLNRRVYFEKLWIHTDRIADTADNCKILTFYRMYFQSLCTDHILNSFYVFITCSWF